MSRPTMLEIYRARKAEEATAPLLAKPTAVPALMHDFTDLDVGDDMHLFLAANDVRDRLGAELVRLASTVHGGKDVVAMILDARSPAFWIDLDRGDIFKAFHRVMEIRAVVAQTPGLKRRH